MRPNISEFTDVSHIQMASLVVRIEALVASQRVPDVASRAPSRCRRIAAGALVQLTRQVVHDPRLRRDDQVRHGARRGAFGSGKSCAIAANGTNTLSLSGPL